MRREVTGPLHLDREAAMLLDHHSLLNLFNVLEMQLGTISVRIPQARVRRFADFCLDVLMNLSRTGLHEQLPAMEHNCGQMRAVVLELLEAHPQEAGLLNGVLEIIQVGHSRLEEFKGERFAWQPIPRQQFHQTLTAFLQATERVSEGRFRFVYPPQPPAGDAYLIDFSIAGRGDSVHAPAVLHDAIRDLVGNARKYSDPGGSIRIELEPEGARGLRLRVSDTGYGIPEEEIDKVVHFGYRATNVLDRRTMGGGFGLTKAYNLCRKCNGRFFIDSTIGRGTTVELTLFDAT